MVQYENKSAYIQNKFDFIEVEVFIWAESISPQVKEIRGAFVPIKTMPLKIGSRES